MKIISAANKTVLTILGDPKEGTNYRMLHYTVELPVDDGMLIYNLLTKEMVLLTQKEYEGRLESEYMRKQWFAVPVELKDKDFSTKVRWVEKMRRKKEQAITSYTILTTSDCNARCFYCFELGWKRMPMTEETAKQTLEYIKKHCGGKKVRIMWFGGEPLFNMEPMDIISQGLRDAGIEYVSAVVTNGYLLDEKALDKAKNLWNMRQVQIALDGTEEVYNKIKAYIYKGVNPYQVVMRNIGLALDAEVPISIRLNMDLSNHQDLMDLVDEMAQRFKDKKGLSIYGHHLFKSGVASAELHSAEDWIKRETAMDQLEQKIEGYGLMLKGGISKSIKVTHCMADSAHSVVVHANGDLGNCQQYMHTDVFGHVGSDEVNMEMINSWREQAPEIPECATCFFYPNCLELKKCASSSVCFQQVRETKLRRTMLQMTNEYEKWRKEQQ